MLLTPNVKWCSVESLRISNQTASDDNVYKMRYIKPYQIEKVKSQIKYWINGELKRDLEASMLKKRKCESSSR